MVAIAFKCLFSAVAEGKVPPLILEARANLSERCSIESEVDFERRSGHD